MAAAHRHALATVVVALAVHTLPAHAETDWSVHRGSALIAFDEQQLHMLELDVRSSSGRSASPQIHYNIGGDSTLLLTEDHGVISASTAGQILLTDGLHLTCATGHHATGRLAIVLQHAPGGVTWAVADDGGIVFALRDVKSGLDRPGKLFLLEAGGLIVSAKLADSLGDAKLAGESIGSLTLSATLTWEGGDEVPTAAELFDANQTAGLRTTCGGTGPDVIVGDLANVASYASVGGIAAFSLSTDSCNIGDTPLNWVSSTNQHPVIGQNMYRLKDGRFEQVGMSWLKHGFAALTENLCGCGCQAPGTSSLLGVGCSDTYSASLNGQQSRLGPRFEVNPHTGFFPYPFTGQNQTGDSIYKRLQVAIADLDPAIDGGGLYFIEGQYVTPDDALAGNQDNNASYRQVSITGGGTSWTASVTGMPPTQREAPAIRAWAATDAGVVGTDVRITGEGLVLLAAKATDLGGGLYQYEYAVQNLNSDRAVGGVRVPMDPTGNVSNIGFHDVSYHSGEPFDGTDWPGKFGGGDVKWGTDLYTGNPNANALRWGTLYNFRFQADRPPQQTLISLDLFKPGVPAYVLAETIGPATGLLDCNSNGVDDIADIAGGTSRDCNTNGAPDECDLESGAGHDLNSNGVLDECESLCATTVGDADGDCDVDLQDYAAMQRCFTGDIGTGSVVYATGCACLDADGDGDVDGSDYASVAAELQGPNVPAAGCAP